MYNGLEGISVRARAPLRLGLAGGGSDVTPYCDEYGGHVLNVTINRYAYSIIEQTHNGEITFLADDRQHVWSGYPQSVQECKTADLALHKSVYLRIMRDYCNGRLFPLRLTTFSDAPPGSGLGTSSALVVSMVQAFVEWLKLPLGEYEVAHLAYEIERKDAGMSGGKQDQYSAAFGGFNFMEFYSDDRVIVNPLRIKPEIISEFETSLVLYFTGISRRSAAIINEQRRNVENRDSSSIEATHEVKREATLMKEALLKGDFEMLAESMRRSWNFKKQMAGGISSSSIERAYEEALNAGARAGKVSGAGGGGFMMFLTNPAKKMNVIRALESEDGYIMTCYFTKHGAQGWKV